MTKALKFQLSLLDQYLKSGANEIVINRPHEIYLDYNGRWSEAIRDENLTFENLRDLCVELATAREMIFSADRPFLSCSIPETTIRVQAVHQIALRDSQISITIRIPSQARFPLESFRLGNAKDPKQEKKQETKQELEFGYAEIRELVAKKKNILISGGTGSGKTSFLNSILDTIEGIDRIVTIEDSPELSIQNPNKAQLLIPKIETENITYAHALNSAMRMRPDRILLGEIDTRNTLAFLRLANTGHSGMISTLHANTSEDAITALLNNALFGVRAETALMTKFITTAIDYIIQIERRGGERFIAEILDLKNWSKKEASA